jgi:hypothetical protein
MDQLVAARGPNRLLQPRSIPEAEAVHDALSEILGSWTMASPTAGHVLLRTLDDVARRHDDLDDIARALDVAAIHCGQHDEPEACDLLLQASDSIRAALDRITTTNDTYDREG